MIKTLQHYQVVLFNNEDEKRRSVAIDLAARQHFITSNKIVLQYNAQYNDPVFSDDSEEGQITEKAVVKMEEEMEDEEDLAQEQDTQVLYCISVVLYKF